jgi:hypothetical protein
MRTQDLISRLASDLTPVERDAIPRRLNQALLTGLAGSTVLLVAIFGFSSDMPEQILTLGFWVRLAFPLAIITAALKLVDRLARPGMPLGLTGIATLVPILTMMLVAAGLLFGTPVDLRLQLMLSSTWRNSTASVVLLSLPSLATAMYAMKGLAPTRLALAGAGAGVLAGAEGLLVYSLYCSDMPVSVWSMLHVLAILVTTCIGAALAPSYLRW